jgi:hypothetical protein
MIHHVFLLKKTRNKKTCPRVVYRRILQLPSVHLPHRSLHNTQPKSEILENYPKQRTNEEKKGQISDLIEHQL